MRWSSSRYSNDIYQLWVSPTEIEQVKLFPPASVPVTGENALCGAVGGPWDKLSIPFEQHYLYQSIHAYLNEDVDWTETQLFEHPKYENDPQRAMERCEKIETIIESIQSIGYRLQSEIEDQETNQTEWIGNIRINDEIIIALDRHGEFLHLKNGRHRLAIAKLLNVDTIPVILSLYHPRAVDKIPGDVEPL